VPLEKRYPAAPEAAVVLGSHYPNPLVDGALILLSPPNTVLRERPATSEPSGPHGPTCADTAPNNDAPADAFAPPSKWPPKAQRGQRKVDPIGNISFADATYNVDRAWVGQLVEVFTADGVVYVVSGRTIIKRHTPKHAPDRETAAIRDVRRGQASTGSNLREPLGGPY